MTRLLKQGSADLGRAQGPTFEVFQFIFKFFLNFCIYFDILKHLSAPLQYLDGHFLSQY